MQPVACRGHRPGWVANTPLADSLTQLDAASLRRLEPVREALPDWVRVPPITGKGSGTLVLCSGEQSTGQVARHFIQKAGCEVFEVAAGQLTYLPALVASYERVVWVLPEYTPQPAAADGLVQRHGVYDTVAALLFGIAEAQDLPVRLLVAEGAIAVADVAALERTLARPGDLPALITDFEAGDAPQMSVAGRPLASYRAWVHERHATPLAYVTRLGLTETELAPVDLDVREGAGIHALSRGDEPRSEGRTGPLLALLREDVAAAAGPVRWLVKAEPGAGKTTMLRQVAATLTGVPRGPVPLFVSLAAWEDKHPQTVLDVATEKLGSGSDGASVRRAVGRQEQWWLLDGFDEVRDPEAMRARILEQLDRVEPQAVVVTSRASQVRAGKAWQGFTSARVDLLDERKGRALALGLLGGDAEQADAFWQAMDALPAVSSLLRNPFLLTLSIAMWQQARDEEKSRPSWSWACSGTPWSGWRPVAKGGATAPGLGLLRGSLGGAAWSGSGPCSVKTLGWRSRRAASGWGRPRATNVPDTR